MATIKAEKTCREWLKTCLDLGWPVDALPDLEKLWWRWHDEAGNLISSAEEGR